MGMHHHERPRGNAEDPGRDPRTTLGHDNVALAQLAGAVALLVAAVWVTSQLPLFGRSGIGEDIALLSCISGMLLALSVIINWMRQRRGRDDRSSRWGTLGGIVVTVVALSACLDALALLQYFIHG